jgi:hypothetical protein
MRHLPEFANRFCGHSETRFHLDTHLIWQTTKNYVEGSNTFDFVSHGLPPVGMSQAWIIKAEYQAKWLTEKLACQQADATEYSIDSSIRVRLYRQPKNPESNRERESRYSRGGLMVAVLPDGTHRKGAFCPEPLEDFTRSQWHPRTDGQVCQQDTGARQ